MQTINSKRKAYNKDVHVRVENVNSNPEGMSISILLMSSLIVTERQLES